MEKSVGTILTRVMDVITMLRPDVTPITLMIKGVIEDKCESENENKWLDIDAINKDVVRALEMVQKIESDEKQEDKDMLFIKFNRELTREEYDKFFDTDAFNLIYLKCKVTMESMEIGSNWSNAWVCFEENLEELEIAKFAVFIDRYLQTLNKELFVKAVYA